MTWYLSRMSGIRVSPKSATAANESRSGIRHRLTSRCERTLVGRGASIRCEFQMLLSSQEQSLSDWTESQVEK